MLNFFFTHVVNLLSRLKVQIDIDPVGKIGDEEQSTFFVQLGRTITGVGVMDE